MSLNLSKDSIDLGIVVRDGEKALAFYRDLLGFDYQGEMAMGGGTVMHRLLCGSSLIKLVAPATPPEAAAAPGGIQGASGIRYWTISVSDLDEIAGKLQEAGVPVPIPPREIRPGVRIAMAEDPDGNWVEFLENRA